MDAFTILEFDKIREKLRDYALTETAKDQCMNLAPFLEEMEVRARLRETSEARMILDQYGNPPLTALSGVKEVLNTAKQEGCLLPEQLEQIEITLTAVQRLKDFLCRAKSMQLSLPYYELELNSMAEIREEIRQKIRAGRVDDYATKQLHDIRAEIERIDQKMRMKADSILKANKECLADQFITTKNGRICIPVKRDYKFRIPGTVVEKSSTGATLFIEPAAVTKYGEERQLLKIDEENEEKRILYILTAMVADQAEGFDQNMHIMEKLDFIFAKGKLSAELSAIEPDINTERRIVIKDGRHPLMNPEICVPLNFETEEGIRGTIITGPNTGGKTVAIKTVGLHSIMAQSGLHVPAIKADLCMNNQVMCDVGDGQDITQNLSTFSSHITNVLAILKKATPDSLVILDELGSGTDPTEGMGIAIAILEELRKCGCLFLATTHYPEVKEYAEKTKEVRNARMAFDRNTLKPLYRLEIGAAGESCAFYIAKRLGMPEVMLACASKAAYGKEELPFMTEVKELKHEHAPSIKKQKETAKRQIAAEQFSRGDSVMIYPDKKIGIVCQTANEKGVLQVQLQGKKIWINHKRIKQIVPADKLYPSDYDFSIIFDSPQTRKIRHDMERKYCEDLVLEESSDK
ncbi:MAG: DNA mismatch repair protein MutS [Lachnospiraceae bacterium]|nr:DNA mismatch repair protein MutS [Lachnospiraceae bacterium]